MSRMPILHFIRGVRVHGEEPSARTIPYRFPVEGSHSVIDGSVTYSDIPNINFTFRFENLISCSNKVKTAFFIVFSALGHISGEKQALMEIWIGVRFEEPNGGGIICDLDSINHAIFRGVFFIGIGLKAHQDLDHSPSFVDGEEQFQRIIVPGIEESRVLADLEGVLLADRK